MIKELIAKLKTSKSEQKENADESDKQENLNENDSQLEVKETKTVILTKLLLEVTFFARKIKNLETQLYKREQITEAAQAEAVLESGGDKKQVIQIGDDGEEIKEKDEEDDDKKPSAFFKIIKNALGIILTLLPVIFAGFDGIKKMFGELPDIMNGSFKDIVLSLFGKLQSSINQYVFSPIAEYLKTTITDLWRSLVLSVEETFVNVVGSLPTFLKDNLPDVIKGMVESATEDVAQGKTPGKQPEVQPTVGSTGSFGVTQGAEFGGEYKTLEYGTPAPAAPPPATSATTPVAQSVSTAPSSVSSSSVIMSETTEATSTPSQSTDASRVLPAPKMPDAVSAMPEISQDVDKNFGLIETALKNLGIDDPKYVRAVKANVMKESQGKAIEENLRYGGTSNERIRSIFGERARRFTDEQLNQIKKDPVQMGELMYGAETKIGRGMGNTDPGDGYKFRGRGFIQLTGKNNYTNASKDLFKDDRLAQNPDLVLDPTIAALVTAWYMKKGKSSMAKRLGIDENNMTQEEANLLATSQIAGSDVRKWKGGYGQELLAKVGSYSNQLAPSGTSESIQVASAPTNIMPAPVTKGVEIGTTTQAVKDATEKKEDKEQAVVIQTAMAAQQPQIDVENPKRVAGASVGSAKTPTTTIQRSYASYFAVA